jgi:hypothetical protein
VGLCAGAHLAPGPNIDRLMGAFLQPSVCLRFGSRGEG